MILFALFLLYSGVKLLLDPDGDAQPELSSSDDPHWTVSAIGGCVPLRWAEKHDDSCVAYEPSPPAARALVGCADDSRLEMPYGLDSEGFNTESGDMEDLDGTPALRRPLSMAFPRPASSPINAQSSTLRPSVSAFDAQKERAVRSDPRGQATDVAASYASSKNDRDRRCGGFGLTRLAVAVGGIVLCDLLFAFDSTPAMLSVTRVPFLLVASQVWRGLPAKRPSHSCPPSLVPPKKPPHADCRSHDSPFHSFTIRRCRCFCCARCTSCSRPSPSI